MAEFLLEVEVIRAQRKSMLDSLKKMQEVNEALAESVGVDAVLDCVATSESLEDALSCVKAGGQIVVVGNPKGDISIDKNIYWKILRKQIRMTGTWNSSFTHSKEDDWNKVLQSCADGSLRLKELITHEFAFDELHKGLTIMKNKTEYRNKVMICKE